MKTAASAFLVLFAIIVLFSASYTVPETEQVIITQFGKAVGQPVTDSGLHFKLPLIQTVNRIEKRVLEWDGIPTEMPTKDKLYITVDTYARWRIANAETYFVRLRDERSAVSRMNDILSSETRNAVAAHDLVEMVRTTKDRKPATDTALAETALSAGLPPIQIGRARIDEKILEESKAKLNEYGIELLDIRIKRVMYHQAVAAKIFQRMVSERAQIADRYRSEGQGEAAKILGQRERDLKQIESEAYRQVQAIEGKADAEASAIYASAYNQTPQAREFYGFIRSLETYRTAFDRGTTVVLTTDDGFLRFLKGDPAPITNQTPAPRAP